MIDFEIINAGDCAICGKPIIIPATTVSDKLPDIFVCKTCLTHIVEWDVKSKRERNSKEVD